MLEKFKNFMKGWGMTILMVFVLFKSCGTSSDADKAMDYSKRTYESTDSTMISFEQKLDGVVTKKEVVDEMEKIMLDFIIYEDELDKKTITISHIKEKIEEND